MKKKVFLSVFFLTVTIIGLLVSGKDWGNTPQDMTLLAENIEALSQGEEVVITCSASQYGGRCFIQTYNLKYCGSYYYYECRYTGYQHNYCDYPCN